MCMCVVFIYIYMQCLYVCSCMNTYICSMGKLCEYLVCVCVDILVFRCICCYMCALYVCKNVCKRLLFRV